VRGCRGPCWWGFPTRRCIQARDRCKAAVSNSGQEWPISLLTINLSPATLPKAGSHYDLAIVAAVLAAQGIFGAVELRRTALLGELGLDGRLRPIRGLLPATLAAQQAGFTRVIVPLRQAGEASSSQGSTCSGLHRSLSWSPSCRVGRCRWSIRST
jgi:magnesium chelatase family protein